MNQSEQIGELVAALAKAQGAIVNPQKNQTVDVETRSGRNYSFSYADLTAIIDSIKKPLSENSLAYTQTLAQDDSGRYRLTTRLLHSSGQWISSETPLFVDEGGSQQFGSALTFMKRYALAAILGVAADTDDDANAADGNKATFKDKAAARKPKEPAPSAIVASAAAPQAPSAPMLIPVPLSPDGKGNDWIAWGSAFVNAALASKTPAEADHWLTMNQENLHAMQAEAMKVFTRVKSATAGVYPSGLYKE